MAYATWHQQVAGLLDPSLLRTVLWSRQCAWQQSLLQLQIVVGSRIEMR
jgi:hypothetical protein